VLLSPPVRCENGHLTRGKTLLWRLYRSSNSSSHRNPVPQYPEALRQKNSVSSRPKGCQSTSGGLLGPHIQGSASARRESSNRLTQILHHAPYPSNNPATPLVPAYGIQFDLGQVPLLLELFVMAPITDGTVDSLKELVSKLEARVAHLEARLEGKEKGHSGTSMRMILIGPPGAGMFAIRVIGLQMA
jgi:hypothetical protein